MWINLPFCGLAFIAVPTFITLHFKTMTLKEKLARIDCIGLALFVISITAFLIPITWGGIQYEWTSWHTLVPLLVGAFGLIGFVLYELYVPLEPLIPMSVFDNRTSNLAFLSNFLHGIVLWCILYYIPLYYEAVKGYNEVVSGVAMFPFTFTVAPMAIIVGLLCTKTGKYRRFIWIGWTITLVGTGLLQLLSVNISIPGWVFDTLVFGIGCGTLFPPMAWATQASASEGNLASAVAMFSFFRVFGQCLGVALGGTVFQNAMQGKLLNIPEFASVAREYAKNAAALVEILKAMPASQSAEKLLLRTAYNESLKNVFILLAAVAAVALLSSLGIKSLDTNRALKTEQGFRRREPNTIDEELALSSPREKKGGVTAVVTETGTD
jgi:hypothetical protein